MVDIPSSPSLARATIEWHGSLDHQSTSARTHRVSLFPSKRLSALHATAPPGERNLQLVIKSTAVTLSPPPPPRTATSSLLRSKVITTSHLCVQ